MKKKRREKNEEKEDIFYIYDCCLLYYCNIAFDICRSIYCVAILYDMARLSPIIGNSPYFAIWDKVSGMVNDFQEILRILDIPLLMANIFLAQTYFYLLEKYPNDKQKEHKQRLSNKMQRLSDEYLKTQDELNKLNGEGKSE